MGKITMATIPGPAPLACPKCGNTSTYKPNTSNGSSVVTCVKCKKNFRIEVRNGQIYGVS
jgi:transcription elongation factor Elf1